MASEFLRLLHVEEALELLISRLPEGISTEEVDIETAGGRVLAEEVRATRDLPGFERSQMDGFAVRARDTFGASETMPAYLEIVGEVPMGVESPVSLGAGQAAYISTGGAMPEGADAVVMVEDSEVSGITVEVFKQVAPGENVIRRDEDIAAGSPVLQKGLALNPTHIGALAGMGISRVTVFTLPRVAILSTGDELEPFNIEPGPARVRDVNSPALRYAVEEAGCLAVPMGIVRDRVEEMREACSKALETADALLLSGGSSAGVRDHTIEVVGSLGEPGVIGHGIYLKPGKPTVIGVCGDKAVLGLPGNPASALAVFREVAEPALRRLRGEAPPYRRAPRTVEAVMDRSHVSDAGRCELLPVELRDSGAGLRAVPVAGKSMLIGTLARASGQVRIPEGKEGLEAGEKVTVELL